MTEARAAPASLAPSRLGSRDVPATAALLARAFDADPFAREIMPTPEARRRYNEIVAASHVRAALPFGHVFGVHDAAGLLGVAIWHPPSVSPGSLTETATAVLHLLPTTPTALTAMPRLASRLALPPSAVPRLAIRRWAAIRSVTRSPSWHLAYLATDPASQGQGIGRRLLDHMLTRFDLDGSGVWLETTDPVNPPIYERFGFATVARIDTSPRLPTLWVMHRPPAG